MIVVFAVLTCVQWHWCKKSDCVQVTNSNIPPPPPNFSFHKATATLCHTHLSEAYPFYKNCKSNPFNRDTEWLPKNVLFTTLRLNRKYTAFPQRTVENEFPMSGGMQSGACVFLAILIYSELRQRNQWSGGTTADCHHSFHISLHFNAARAQKVLKSVSVVARLARNNGQTPYWTKAALRLSVVTRTEVR